MIAEIPLGIIAVEIVRSEGRCGVTCTVKTDAGVDTFLSGDYLRHDAIGAVGELLDAPELFVSTCIGRNGCHLLVCSSSKGTICPFDGDLEVGIAEIATCLVDRGDGPTLVRTMHIVADTGGNVTLRPCADDIV